MSSESPAVILYDADGNPVAIAQGDEIIATQKGLLAAGQNEDGYAEFLTISKYTGALKTTNVGSLDILGRYYAGSSLITGSASAQNLLTLENPAGSTTNIRLDRVIIKGYPVGTSTIGFLYSMNRTTGLPSGGTSLTIEQRLTTEPAAQGVVREQPMATAASGNFWVGSPGVFLSGGGSGGPAGSASANLETLEARFEREEITVLPGEAIVIRAGANSTDWRHWVNISWFEVTP